MRNQDPEEITLFCGIKKRAKINSNIEAEQTFTSIYYDKMLIPAFFCRNCLNPFLLSAYIVLPKVTIEPQVQTGKENLRVCFGVNHV